MVLTINLEKYLSQLTDDDLMLYVPVEIKETKKKKTDDKLTKYSLWETTKILKMHESQSYPNKIKNGNWAGCNQQEGDLFSEYLVKTFTSYDSSDADLLINYNILENSELSPFTKV